MKDLNDRVVAITGAASGIGRALSFAFARRGCHLALSDVDLTALESVAQDRGMNKTVTVHGIDMADATAVGMRTRSFKSIAVATSLSIMQVTSSGSFLEHDLGTWRRIMDINVMGVVHGCRAFLPHFLHNDEGHIVNISSIFGIIGLRGSRPIAPINSLFVVCLRICGLSWWVLK